MTKLPKGRTCRDCYHFPSCDIWALATPKQKTCRASKNFDRGFKLASIADRARVRG